MRSIKGIPYAAPPVGDLRWRPPQPVTPWQGTRDAANFSLVCLQPNPIPGSFYQKEYFQTVPPQSEDCLTLNVWAGAAAGSAPRPVIVFLHGGGNTGWSSAMPPYDGTGLARKGAVVVTLNYRLGAMGFLTHPELDAESPHQVSGNDGLLDQFAALQWVKSNIAAFGGDADRVTLMGHSAGGADISWALVSPLAKGLFRRAIIMSGGVLYGINTLAIAESRGRKLLSELGAPFIAALRDMPATRIVAHIGRNFVYGLYGATDGWVLPQSPIEMLATGQVNGAEVMLGSTANEGTALLRPATPESLRNFATSNFGPQTDPIAALYPATDAASATAAQDQLFSDYQAAMPRVVAGLIEGQGHPAWIYHFNRPAPGSDPVTIGAFHGSELVYVFASQSTVDRPWEDSDRQLSDVMSSYWVNFAATGNPNGPGLPDWPGYDEATRHVQDLGARTVSQQRRQAEQLLETYLRSKLPKPK